MGTKFALSADISCAARLLQAVAVGDGHLAKPSFADMLSAKRGLLALNGGIKDNAPREELGDAKERINGAPTRHS